MKKTLLIIALAILSAASCTENAGIGAQKCEWVDSPICIDTNTPRLSWNYYGDDDFIQKSYVVTISAEKDGSSEIWNSGTVETARPLCKVEGAELKSFTTYYWQVKALGNDGITEYVSPFAKFETAMMETSDWTGKWISDGLDKDLDAAPMFRKSFNAGCEVEKARLYISGVAYADAKINGSAVSDALLNPGYTHYDKRNLYSVFDVTALIEKGENVLSVVAGNGFYNEIRPVATWNFENARWRNRAAIICELHLTYKDGTVDIIPSDASWKTTADGPYLSNNIYSGDIYDARKEITGWEKPGFDDSAYADAVETAAPSPVLTAQVMNPIAPEEYLKPVSVKKFSDTLYVFDFGRNIAGFCNFTAVGEEGTKVQLEYGELAKADGRIEMGNINIYFYPAEDYHIQTDIYYMKGQGTEKWAPKFCYHGFRYVSVSSDKPLSLDKNSLEAVYFHTLMDSAGTFECSNELFNTIWDMARRTYKNNCHSIVTDCPTREKNGWTADSFLATELALLNFDAAPFYNKWYNDVIDNLREDGRISGIIPTSDWGYDDWIGPVWDAAIFTIPEYVYNFNGDPEPAERLWNVWVKYLEYLKTREESDGLPTYGIGDWVYYKVATPTAFTTPVFYYKDYCVMARFAEILGKDPEPWKAKAEAIKEAINAKWFHPETDLYAEGSQAAQGVALYFGIVPEGHEQAVADNLAKSIEDNNGYLEFGSMGSKTVLRMLTKYGHVNTVYRMATKEDCPSWGWWVKQGFTTLAETWPLDPNFRDASIDHVFLGDIAAWFVNDLAGINYDTENPGFAHTIIRPHFPEGLDWAKASYRSAAGMIKSEWRRNARGGITLKIEIPTNTTATVIFGEKEIEVGAGTNEFNI